MYGDTNNITITGNLGQDPEARSTTSGKAVTTIQVGSTQRFKQGDEWKNDTTWLRCVAFGPRAESIAKHCKQGDKVLVQGRIRTRSYEKDGETRYSTDVVISNIQRFTASKKALSAAVDEAANEDLPAAEEE